MIHLIKVNALIFVNLFLDFHSSVSLNLFNLCLSETPATEIGECQWNLQALQAKHLFLCRSVTGTKISKTEREFQKAG